MVLPPVDHAQLEKLRTSLQRLPGLRILSLGGSPGSGTQISVTMDKPVPLDETLLKMDVVEEAIAEDLLDTHPLGDFLLKSILARQTKRSSGEQRFLVVLKKA